MLLSLVNVTGLVLVVQGGTLLDWACLGGTRRDFLLGCPLAAAALGGCWVDGCRWIQPHFSVCASFLASRWSAKVVQFSPLWPAFWVSAVDKIKTSRSAEGRDIWEIYDKSLEFIPAGHALAINDALAGTDVHLAWAVWSTAAESALVCAFGMASGPMPPNGLVLGRGSALLRVSNIGGNRVRRMRPDSSIFFGAIRLALLPQSLGDWAGSGDFVSGTGSGALAADPHMWTDGSLVLDEVTHVCCGEAGVFAVTSGACGFHRSWGHLDLLPPDENSGSERCRHHLSVPRPLQIVQRAENLGGYCSSSGC